MEASKKKAQNIILKIIVQLFVVLATLVGTMILLNITEESLTSLKSYELENESTILESLTYSPGYGIYGKTYTVTEKDPKLFFSFNAEKNCSIVSIRFSTPPAEGTMMEVFYPDESAAYAYSNENSIIQYSDGETLVYYFKLPVQYTKELRIDIDDSFILEDITTSEGWKLIRYSDAELSEYAPVCIAGILFTVLELIAALLKKLILLGLNIAKNPNDWLEKCYLLIVVILLAAAGYFAGNAIGIHYTETHGIVYGVAEKIYFSGAGSIIALIIGLAVADLWRTEAVFAMVLAFVGTMLLTLMPTRTFLSWDDTVHYEDALTLSYGGKAYITEADQTQIDNRLVGFQGKSGETAYIQDITQEDSTAVVDEREDSIWNPTNAGLIPHAVGLWLGRIMGADYIQTYNLGRILSFAVYLAIMMTAVRHACDYKMLVCTVALLPIAVFQSCNYTYDGWIIAWVTLGSVLFYTEIRSREYITIRKELMIALCLIIGILPKLVYFPILLMLFFVPKQKFKDNKTWFLYYFIGILALAAALLLLFYYVTGNPSITTDTRGGDDVNAGKQLAYIMQNIERYISVLVNYFTGDYFAFENCDALLTNIGYYPYGMKADFGGTVYVAVFLLIVSLTCRTRDTDCALKKLIIPKSGIVIAAFGTICAVATTMYLAFSPVGAKTVSGCQGRYMIPLLFLSLSIFDFGKGLLDKKYIKWYEATASCAIIIYYLIFFRQYMDYVAV